MQKYKDTHKHDSHQRSIGESVTELELRRSVIVVNNIEYNTGYQWYQVVRSNTTLYYGVDVNRQTTCFGLFL